nr:hypothetical protein [Tanacetum cinerariifolium]
MKSSCLFCGYWLLRLRICRGVSYGMVRDCRELVAVGVGMIWQEFREEIYSRFEMGCRGGTTPGNTSPKSSNDLTKYLLATLVFSPLHVDPYIEVMQAYDATNELLIPPLQAPIASPTVMPHVLSLFDSQYFLPPEEISPPKDAETPVESSIPVSPSSSVGSSSPVRSITPPDYPFDESIFAELDNSLWIKPQLLGSKPVSEEPNESDAHL